MKFEAHDLGCYQGLVPSLCALALLATVSAAWAIPGQYVVPNNLANVEGNSSVNDFLNSSSFRMQMVFDASQFAGLPEGPNISNSVTSISFRLDGDSTDTVLYSFAVSVTLSTTPKTPDSLSPVFAENVGADAVTIRSGFSPFGAAYQPGADPQPFAQNITATSPFYYYPSRGNLLVDIRGVDGRVLFPGSLDAQEVMGDPVSRVFAAGNLSSTGTPDTLSLVTRFNITVIPEPSTTLLAGLGLVLLALIRRR